MPQDQIRTRRSAVRLTTTSLAFGVVVALGFATPLSATAAGTAPVAQDDTYEVSQGGGLFEQWDFPLENDADAEGGWLQMDSFSLPHHGSFVSEDYKGQPYSFLYTPDPDYYGPDSLQYRAVDPDGNVSNLATINITVTQNQAPVAVADKYSATSGKPLTISPSYGVLANDTDADHDYIVIAPNSVTQPLHGTLTMNPNVYYPGFSYLPDDGYVGSDSFQYQVMDDYNLGNVATVTFDVKAGLPKVATVAIDKITPGIAGGLGWISAQITSSNAFKAGAPVDAYIDGQKVGSGVTDKNGAATIQLHLPDKTGNFSLKIVSGTKSATDSIQISRERPTVSSLTVGLPGGKAGQGVYLTAKIGTATPIKAGAIVDVFVDGEAARRLTDSAGMARIPLKLPSVAGKHSIKVVADSKSVTKVITLGTETMHRSRGSTKMRVRIQRPFGRRTAIGALALAAAASLSFAAPLPAMAAANTAPVAHDDHYKIAADHYLLAFWNSPGALLPGLLSNDTDGEGDALSGFELGQPQHGQVFEFYNGNGDKSYFEYDPESGYEGTDTIPYRIQDARGNVSNWATITIDVVPIVLPVSLPDSYTAVSGQLLKVPADKGLFSNDTNVYSDFLKLSKFAATSTNGGFIHANSDGSLSYLSVPGYVGTDTFVYNVVDSFGYKSGLTALTITVKPAPPRRHGSHSRPAGRPAR